MEFVHLMKSQIVKQLIYLPTLKRMQSSQNLNSHIAQKIVQKTSNYQVYRYFRPAQAITLRINYQMQQQNLQIVSITPNDAFNFLLYCRK
ncbi:unnamed protein product [Paramecium sonneborni]|uniref:Uncharacterized protein n=1 Tax=Paramecium sonneborni TaxID=65129 RepID=A0A8S1RRD8_9CILI|nr:unnamed protein product [Paramecium sonneborni]